MDRRLLCIVDLHSRSGFRVVGVPRWLAFCSRMPRPRKCAPHLAHVLRSLQAVRTGVHHRASRRLGRFPIRNGRAGLDEIELVCDL